MVCKKCGYEVLDENATYCGVCGSRLDGKKTCPACKKPNEENVTYCVYCGERMDGKTVCSACNTTYEGQFCLSCGKSAFAHTAQMRTKNFDEEKVCRLFDVIGSGILMLGVLFSLIFVFLISVIGDVSVIKIADLGLDADVSIFDYFGKYYKEMGESANEMEWFYDIMSSQELIAGIMGTVIVGLTLCAVVGFAIVASIIFVRNCMGLSQRKADKWAIATIISFFAGVVTFCGLHRFSLSYNGIEGVMKLSSATVWGIVLCSIALVCSVVCKIISQGKENLQPKKIIGLCLSVLSIAFCATLFGMLGNFSILSKMSMQGESLTMNAGAMVANVLLIACGEQRVGFLSRGDETDLIYSNVETFTIFSTITQGLLILTVIVILAYIIQKLGSLFSRKQSSVLPWAIIVAALAVACLVLSIIANNCISEIFEMELSLSSSISNSLLELEGSILMPILFVVFAVLNLIVACVQSALNVKWKKESKAE